jgi:hypothetical protein
MRAMRVQCVMTVAVSVGLFGAPVVAQAPAGAVACHESQLFVAIGRDRLDEVGTDFIIRRKDKPDGKTACAFEPTASDYRIGGPDLPYSFLAIAGRYLALTASTGPSGTLDIFDLENRKAVLHARYTEADEPQVTDGKITFSRLIGPATAKACRNYRQLRNDGGRGEIGAKASFDLASGTLTKTSTTRCTASQ